MRRGALPPILKTGSEATHHGPPPRSTAKGRATGSGAPPATPRGTTGRARRPRGRPTEGAGKGAPAPEPPPVAAQCARRRAGGAFDAPPQGHPFSFGKTLLESHRRTFQKAGNRVFITHKTGHFPEHFPDIRRTHAAYFPYSFPKGSGKFAGSSAALAGGQGKGLISTTGPSFMAISSPRGVSGCCRKPSPSPRPHPAPDAGAEGHLGPAPRPPWRSPPVWRG